MGGGGEGGGGRLAGNGGGGGGGDGGHLGGAGGESRGEGDEHVVQLGGDLADGPVGGQDELQPLLLLQQVSDVVLQVGLIVFQIIRFLSRGKRAGFNIAVVGSTLLCVVSCVAL